MRIKVPIATKKFYIWQVIEALSTIVFDDDKVKKMIEAFEEQIRFANSPDEELRKKTDLFWENTYIRRLLDGNGNGLDYIIDTA